MLGAGDLALERRADPPDFPLASSDRFARPTRDLGLDLGDRLSGRLRPLCGPPPFGQVAERDGGVVEPKWKLRSLLVNVDPSGGLAVAVTELTYWPARAVYVTTFTDV